jgi:hypothetical protein
LGRAEHDEVGVVVLGSAPIGPNQDKLFSTVCDWQYDAKSQRLIGHRKEA